MDVNPEPRTPNHEAHDIPRRVVLTRMTPAERAILDAVRAVEDAGADVRLTDAVNLLSAARESVADYVDGVDRRRRPVLEGVTDPKPGENPNV